MCMEDFSIGRYSRSIRGNLTVTTTINNFLKRNPKRIALIFGGVTTTGVFISDDPGVTITSGFPVTTTNGLWSFNIKDDGEFVTHDFYAVAATGTHNLIWWETLLDFDLPPPKEFFEMMRKRQYG